MQIWRFGMTNTKNGKVMVLTLFCMVIALGAWMSFNASGFCYTKGRYLGQSEIFRKVIEKSLQADSIESIEEHVRNGANRDVKRLLSPTSYEEFERLNPNCCSYYVYENKGSELLKKIRKFEGFSDLHDPPIHHRFLGLAWRSVFVGSNIRYIDSTGAEKSYFFGDVTWINGCGEYIQPPRQYFVG